MNAKKGTQLYPFITENYRGYLDYFDVEGKDVLCAGKACDGILNLALKGAKTIYCFDENPLVPFLFEFKRASVIKLNNPEQYMTFVIDTTSRSHTLNTRGYDAIKTELPDDARMFWDKAVALGPLGDESIGLVNPLKDLSEREKLYFFEKANPYLDVKNFKKLKEMLIGNETEFIFGQSSIYKLDTHKPYKTPEESHKNFSRRYDAIFTSNLNYATKPIKHKQYAAGRLTEMLRPGGMAQVIYQYEPRHKQATFYSEDQFEKISFQHLQHKNLQSLIVRMKGPDK